MSSTYDRGTGCERVSHWATRLRRWALYLAAPFPATRGSIPLRQAFIVNAVASHGPARQGTRIPESFMRMIGRLDMARASVLDSE